MIIYGEVEKPSVKTYHLAWEVTASDAVIMVKRLGEDDIHLFLGKFESRNTRYSLGLKKLHNEETKDLTAVGIIRYRC